MMSCVSSIMGLSDEELAAEFKAYEFLSKDYTTFDAGALPDGTMSVWAFFKLDNTRHVGVEYTLKEN